MAMEKAAKSRFWERFIRLARNHGVPEKSLRWYVVRVEQYIKSHANLPLRQHGPEEVRGYLGQLGREGGLEGWQFQQVAHALQLLFSELLRAAWARSFDWAYWLASGQELETDHPTVARHNWPVALARPSPASGGGEFPYPDLVRDVIAEIRWRNYSIRTEQTYVDWLRRYVRYHGNRHPRELSGADVAAYLSHLAVERLVSPGTQGQALSALVFVYRQVLGMKLEELEGFTPARIDAHRIMPPLRRLFYGIPACNCLAGHFHSVENEHSEAKPPP
ncbi:MAG: phage integrase N-terminal SAM-like domain-containing protein [Gammaproteobacteria bacterium]|nr:phage integrase N-terminal SAM-like domain-containing protein [Gammaproteobacteria bacterium]